MRTLTLAILLAVGSPTALAQNAPAAPQPAPAAPALRAGMPAPEFKVEKFLRGTPFTSLEKGKVYVIEFWATWCGPCIMTMPHLSELQQEFGPKGVTICGVNIWEEPEYTEATLGKAAKFVEARPDAMAYTVAFDGAAKHMDTAWMQAAGRKGIPSAFVVDREGNIAWIGHPKDLDMVLDGVTRGSWSVSEGPAQIKAAQSAFEKAGAEYATSLEAGETAWKAAMASYPLVGRGLQADRFRAMLAGKHYTQAYALGNTLVDNARATKNPIAAMMVYMAIDNPAGRPEVFDKALLLKAAQTSFDLSDPSDYGRHVTMARAYFAIGDAEKGREAAKTALEIAPAEIRPRLEPWLKEIEAKAAAPK